MGMSTELAKERRKMHRAMQKLEQAGFLVLKNHLCCPSCALNDIQNIVDAMPARKLAHVQGCVYWTTQEKARVKDHGLLVVNYCGVILSDGTVVGLDTTDVGKAVVSALTHSGNTVKWNGDPTSCIHVILGPNNYPV